MIKQGPEGKAFGCLRRDSSRRALSSLRCRVFWWQHTEFSHGARGSCQDPPEPSSMFLLSLMMSVSLIPLTPVCLVAQVPGTKESRDQVFFTLVYLTPHSPWRDIHGIKIKHLYIPYRKYKICV